MTDYLFVSEELKDGMLNIKFLEKYELVGLMSIYLPPVVTSNRYTYVEIRVDEIDKTYDNPNRVLDTLCFNKTKDFFQKKENVHIFWQKIDSSNNELNLKFVDEYGHPILLDQNDYSKVNLTLALQ